MLYKSFLLLALTVSLGCEKAVNQALQECTPGKTVSKSGTSASFSEVVELKTTDAAKTCHARMSIRFRYDNLDLAKTDQMPPLEVTAGVVDYGRFEVPAPQRDPSANDLHWWVIKIDQGAKNVPFNPVQFYVRAASEVFSDPIKIEMEINYTSYSL